MLIKPTQLIQILNSYSSALKAVRADYLKLLEMPADEKDINNIWNASFILEYMRINHFKYTKWLNDLTRNSQNLIHLERLCSKLTVDPNIDIQAFIDEVQTQIQSEEFKSELSALSRAYYIEQCLYALCAVLIFIATIAINASIGLICPWIYLSIPIFAVLIVYQVEKAQSALEERVPIDKFLESLIDMMEIPTFSFTESHTYNVNNISDDDVITTKIKHTHQPRLKLELKQSFFQPQMKDKEALNIEVQAKFNKDQQSICIPGHC